MKLITAKIIPVYESNKTYPILVKIGGSYKIVEMLGKVVNEYNDSIKNENYYYISRRRILY